MSAEAAEAIATPPVSIDEEHLIRSVIRMAWPVVVQQVSFSMVQLVDTALVGHLGEDSLAGVRLAGQIFWFSQAGMMALAVGSTAVIARNIGANRPELASRTLRNAILMAVAWGVLVGVVMWFLGSVTMGLLYDRSIMALVVFGIAAQLLAAGMFFRLRHRLAAAVVP